MPMDSQAIEQNFERALGRLEGKLDSMNEVITRLANAFDNLEKGRLSTLEINFAKLQTETSDSARTTATWISAFISIVVTVIGGLLLFYFTK